MRRKKLFIISLVLIFILQCNIVFCYSTQKNTDIKNLINSGYMNNVKEYERIRFHISNTNNLNKNIIELQNIFLKERVKLNYCSNENIIDNDKINTANLYIKKKGESFAFVINLCIKQDNEKISKSILRQILKSFNLNMADIKVCRNIKAKLNNEVNIEVLKNKSEKYLKNNGYNINSIKLNNGFSTKVSQGGNREQGFYYSLCKYSSGNYIVIGDPEIFISY
ncbi:hypothetical protein [Hathewaya limosa]|uniref:Lipoprotein n=1 Tax=Hathewaya limosa TaxID=1536 RepID=A0ABU0JQ77_HATLI|nr:hypothetical protein [Hathewaya limosa]MDQ0478406.1 hypothetical protein [Hathewaya limosa]